MYYVKLDLINTKLSILTINLMIENPCVNDVLSPFSIGSALSQEFKFTTATVSLRHMHACIFCCKACLTNTDFSLLLDRFADHNLICVRECIFFTFNLRPSAKITTMHLFVLGQLLGSNLLSIYLSVQCPKFFKMILFFYSVSIIHLRT